MKPQMNADSLICVHPRSSAVPFSSPRTNRNSGAGRNRPVRDAAAVERRDQGGRAPDAAGDCSGAAGQGEVARGKARSRMSFTSLARLPPWRMMTTGKIHLPQEGIRRLGGRDEARRSAARRCGRFNCEPIVAAGQAMLVDDDYTLDDTVSLTPTPGHSPCHCCVNIRSGGQRASVTGDMMHHALQCREPE
jgi:hypothetical protein